MFDFEALPVNRARLVYDIKQLGSKTAFVPEKIPRCPVVPEFAFQRSSVNLELGAGSGFFCVELAKALQGESVIAVERSKERARGLVRRANKASQPLYVAVLK